MDEGAKKSPRLCVSQCVPDRQPVQFLPFARPVLLTPCSRLKPYDLDEASQS